jgi:hypothetical protein
MTIEITKGNKNPVSDFFSSAAQTPETDYEQFDGFDGQGGMVVGVEFARRLERERDEARAEWYSLQDAFEDSCDKIEKLERERDEAREVASGLAVQEERVEEAQKELSSIHRWIERNHPDGFIDSMTFHQNLERVTDRWYERLERVERERDEAITALDKMSKHLAQFTGSCPYECFDIEPHSDPCSEICDKFTNETNLCWKQHFMKEVEK